MNKQTNKQANQQSYTKWRREAMQGSPLESQLLVNLLIPIPLFFFLFNYLLDWKTVQFYFYNWTHRTVKERCILVGNTVVIAHIAFFLSFFSFVVYTPCLRAVFIYLFIHSLIFPLLVSVLCGMKNKNKPGRKALGTWRINLCWDKWIVKLHHLFPSHCSGSCWSCRCTGVRPWHGDDSCDTGHWGCW